MAITISKQYTPDGFEIVYISEYFFNTLEKELNKISRIPGGLMNSPYATLALRDEPAQIEFRRLEKKYIYEE